MNDEHQVQLYSFGMSTGITTLLGLCYTIDQGSMDLSKHVFRFAADNFLFPVKSTEP